MRFRSRAREVLKESALAARSAPVSSTATFVIVVTVCAVILGIAGQARRADLNVRQQAERAGARLINVRDIDGTAALEAAAVDRVAGIRGVVWAFGLGEPNDARLSTHRGGGPPIAVMPIFGVPPTELGGALPTDAYDRERSAIVGEEASTRLGLVSPIGSLRFPDGAELAVIGAFRPSDPLRDLASIAMRIPSASDRPRSIFVLVANAEAVSDIAASLPEVLGAQDDGAIDVRVSEAAGVFAGRVGVELEQSRRRLILTAVAMGLLLLLVNGFAATLQRRRDVGRRRALGASRAVVIALILAERAITATPAALLCCVAAVVAGYAGPLDAQSIRFGAAVATIGTVTAVVSCVPPAIAAAYADPVRVLRVP